MNTDYAKILGHEEDLRKKKDSNQQIIYYYIDILQDS